MTDVDRFVPAMAFALAFSVPVGYAWAGVAGIRRSLGIASAASLAVILALTLARAGTLPDNGTAIGVCSLGPFAPNPPYPFDLGEELLNVALFMPFGFFLAQHRPSRAWQLALAGSVALPFAIELVQLKVPALGRYCDATDIADNLVGLALGFGFGAIVVWFRQALRRLMKASDRSADA